MKKNFRKVSLLTQSTASDRSLSDFSGGHGGRVVTKCNHFLFKSDPTFIKIYKHAFISNHEYTQTDKQANKIMQKHNLFGNYNYQISLVG